jgi:hypothetical protein
MSLVSKERRAQVNLNIPTKIVFAFFSLNWTWIQCLFDTFSPVFANSYFSLVFFVLASKISQLLITTEDYAAPFYKPNPKGILSQCRYTDIKHFFSLKPSAPKNKPSQTRTAVNLAAEKGVLSLRAAEKRVGVRAACCHLAPPTRGLG